MFTTPCGDGRYARLLKNLARADLLILDDWGLAPLTPEQARDLLEIIDDRHGRGSTIVTSQLPVDHWHEVIGNPTIADAILDRLVHNAHRLTLKGACERSQPNDPVLTPHQRCDPMNVPTGQYCPPSIGMVAAFNWIWRDRWNPQ